MTPFQVVLLGSLHPLALLAGLMLKWWVIWFALGRNFSRTSVLSLLAFSSSSICAWLILHSQAIGPAGPDPSQAVLVSSPTNYPLSAWLAGFLLGWFVLSTIEMWLLRLGMRRMVRSEWSWRRSDFTLYQTVFGVWLSLTTMPLWLR